MTDRVGVYLLDRDGVPLGLIDEPIGFSATVRWMDLGAFSVSLRADNPIASVVARGQSVAVLLDGAVFVSGPALTVARAGVSGSETVEIAGPDDLIRLQWRMATPAAPSYLPNLDDAQPRAGSAEDVIVGYIDANLGGAAAVAGRQLVRLGPNMHRGSAVSDSARFERVFDLAQRNAIVDGLGLACRWDPIGKGFPVFTVEASRDLRTQVRFSPDRQTISSFTSADTAPTATHVLVGGGGTGTGRVFGAVDDNASAADWWRIESFVDAGTTTDTATLIQRAEDSLQQGGLSMVLEAVETEGLRYGDWRVGDIVAGDDGHIETAFVVVEVTLTGPSPFTVSATLAQRAGWRASQLTQVRDRQRDLRLRSLETRT